MLKLLAWCAGFACATPVSAQYGGELGFLITSSGVSFGTRCTRAFSCTYLGGDLWRGQLADLVVRGEFQWPFAIALWVDQPHQCLAVPGILNNAMGSSCVVLVAGSLLQRDGIALCPGGGLSVTTLQVPASLPGGTSLTLQALAHTLSGISIVPGFSMALRATLR